MKHRTIKRVSLALIVVLCFLTFSAPAFAITDTEEDRIVANTLLKSSGLYADKVGLTADKFLSTLDDAGRIAFNNFKENMRKGGSLVGETLHSLIDGFTTGLGLTPESTYYAANPYPYIIYRSNPNITINFTDDTYIRFYQDGNILRYDRKYIRNVTSNGVKQYDTDYRIEFYYFTRNWDYIVITNTKGGYTDTGYTVTSNTFNLGPNMSLAISDPYRAYYVGTFDVDYSIFSQTTTSFTKTTYVTYPTNVYISSDTNYTEVINIINNSSPSDFRGTAPEPDPDDSESGTGILGSILEFLSNILTALISGITELLETLGNLVSNGFNSLTGLLSELLGDITSLIQRLFDSLEETFSHIRDVLDFILEALAGFINLIAESLPKLLQLFSGYTLFQDVFSHFLPPSVATCLWAFIEANVIIFIIRFLLNR